MDAVAAGPATGSPLWRRLGIDRFDRRWSSRIKRGGSGAQAVTRLGKPDVGLIETALAAAMPGLRPRERALLVTAPALAGLVGHTLKRAVKRRRPGLDGFTAKGKQSFPSTHAGHVAALTFAGAAIARRHGYGAWVYALAGLTASAVGVSRLRERAHWPSDVLVGLLIGVALARLAARYWGDAPLNRTARRGDRRGPGRGT
jgi:membrane-associated phospholipid phosphatase